MIDLHCHVLPGIDDGPATMAESVALAREAASAGITTIVATPHVSLDWPANDAELIAERVDAVNAALEEEDVRLRVVPGAEIAITDVMGLDDDELRRLGLGGGPWLLLEPPFTGGGAGIESVVAALAHRGHRIVLAHPERSAPLLHDRRLLERLVRAGTLCSLTAASLEGRFGREARRFSLALLADGLAHNVASDAHGAGGARTQQLGRVLAGAGLGDMADWLCRDVPGALIAGAPVPPAPDRRAPPGRLARLIRRA